MRRKNLLMYLTEKADLPMEPVPGVPVVEIGDDCRVLIENHQGVTEYGTERMQIKVRYGQVRILGEKLTLISMEGQQLVIKGKIHSVELIRGE